LGRITEASLEEVRERIDFVELVREYVPSLKKAGRDFKACCPFHQEKTPSFYVVPEKGIFHCFGCEAGGNVFGFLMKIEGLSYVEAVEKLAERAGVRLVRPERALDPQEKERLSLRRVLEFAREHYHSQLLRLPEADAARRYFAKRGLAKETIEAFKLGYAARSGGLLPAATRQGFGKELLTRCGLASEREGRLREHFWARVLFPILNARGEVCGFGGRVLGDDEPKYLNSPDNVMFSKGRVLYGFHEALPTIRKERHALLLEGYMDVLAAHQAGFRNACAPLGTALTEDHAALLKRHVDRVTFLFDPDAAGVRAAVRGGELMMERGVGVALATVPDGLDPDELLQRGGPESLKSVLAAAEDLVSFQTRFLLGNEAKLSPEQKAAFAARILETIAKCPDEVLKSEWLSRLAQRLKTDEGSLRLQLRKLSSGGGKTPVRRHAAAASPAPSSAGQPMPAEDRDILFCLLRSPALSASEELVDEADFSDERACRIFLRLRSAVGVPDSAKGGGARWIAGFLESLEPADASAARSLLCDRRECGDPARLVSDIVGRLRKKRRLAELEPLIFGKTKSGPVDPDIVTEYKRLCSELQGAQRNTR